MQNAIIVILSIFVVSVIIGQAAVIRSQYRQLLELDELNRSLCRRVFVRRSRFAFDEMNHD